MIIREATHADLPAVIALLSADTIPVDRETTPEDPRYAAAFGAIAADPNQLLIVGEVDGQVVATQQLTFIPGLSFRGAWRCVIEAVRVDDAMRGRGLGRELIVWAVERARKRGCALVQLTSDRSRTRAHDFYERLGFVRSHYGFKLWLGDG